MTGGDNLAVRLNRYRISTVTGAANRSDDFARAVKRSVECTVCVVADNRKIIVCAAAATGGDNLAVRLNRYRTSVVIRTGANRGDDYACAVKRSVERAVVL